MVQDIINVSDVITVIYTDKKNVIILVFPHNAKDITNQHICISTDTCQQHKQCAIYPTKPLATESLTFISLMSLT
jgi:hypothetical protein